MYILDDNEKKLINYYKSKEKQSMFGGWIFIILGVTFILLFILIPVFEGSWKLITTSPTIVVNNVPVKINLYSIIIVLAVGWASQFILLGVSIRRKAKEFTKLINMIDKLSNGK